MLPSPEKLNILITGTPGTGKTTLTERLVQEFPGFEKISIGELIQEHNFFSEYDSKFETRILDEQSEDNLLDFLEPILLSGNKIVDFHSCSIFPERWFHLVVVLHVNTENLYDRLSLRGYSDAKRSENLEAEITQVCEEEARESYSDNIILILQSNTLDDVELNVEKISTWINTHSKDNFSEENMQ